MLDVVNGIEKGRGECEAIEESEREEREERERGERE